MSEEEGKGEKSVRNRWGRGVGGGNKPNKRTVDKGRGVDKKEGRFFALTYPLMSFGGT